MGTDFQSKERCDELSLYLPAGHVEMPENDALARVPRGNLSQFSLHLPSTMILSGFDANK
jgi:hypothetical protein